MPALTGAQRNKKYYDKKRLLNPDEYKLQKKIQNQKYYQKIKANPILHNNNDDTDDDDELLDYDNLHLLDNETKYILSFLDDNKLNHNHLLQINSIIYKDNTDVIDFILFKPIPRRINKLNKSSLQHSTVLNYLSAFKSIFKNFNHFDLTFTQETIILNLLTNKKYDYKSLKSILSFLYKDIYHILQNLSNSHIIILYSILTRVKYHSSFVCKIYPYVLNISLTNDNKRLSKNMNNLILSKYRSISFNLDDVLLILNDNSKFIISNFKRPYPILLNKLLFALLMLFPVRRPCDYIRMFISSSKPIDETRLNIQKRNNYYFDGYFYFYRTKNKNIQVFKVPDQLNSIIIDYISSRTLSIDTPNPLLADVSISSISSFIMILFQNIYGISYSAVELRRFYATYLNQLVKDNKLTELQHRQICDMMNHSFEENKKYAYQLS